MDFLDGNWLVGGTIGEFPQVLVSWEVGVRKVEFDLCICQALSQLAIIN